MVSSKRLLNRLPALLTLACLALPTVAQDGPRRSLQDLLAEQRAQAAAEREALRPTVVDLLGKLQSALNTRNALGTDLPAIGELRAELIALGPTIAPLLLTGINPPDKSDAAKEALAAELTIALRTMPIVVVLPELCTMAREGNRIGRRSALDLLGGAQRRDKVVPILLAAYENDAENRAIALRSLCLQGGPEAEVLLETLLEGASSVGEKKNEPVALLRAALDTMADRGRAGIALNVDQVQFLQRLIHSQALANLAESALPLCAFAPEDALTEAETLAFADLAARSTYPRDKRIAILESLPASGLPYTDGLADELASMIAGTSPMMAEAALLCLAKFGDKKAQSQLLKPYRDDVNKDRNNPAALEARGTILMRLGDYHDATLDLKKAIKIIENDKDRSPFLANGAYTTLARTYCRMGEYKDAYKALKDSSLATNQLRKLADDPDFAPLVADPKFKPVFRL